MSNTSAVMGSLPIVMLIMLISGSANTLLMKFMVLQKVPLGPGGVATGFDHPYFQSLLMMIGEFLCLLVYLFNQRQSSKEKVVGPSNIPKSVFFIACLFDWTATTLVNMSYILIAASVVQMTRGAIVIFTCAFSVIFLKRQQFRYHMVGVGLVFIGITLVSLSTFYNPVAQQAVSAEESQASMHSKLLGIALCVGAQVFQASMLVYEESIMSKYPAPPLLVVGMEGAFGIGVGIVLLSFLNPMGIESTPNALYQMGHSTPLMFAVIASIFSIAFFNYSGVTVTQQASCVARSTIDVSRTVIIWLFELALGWNSFNVLQLVGFVILALGAMLYNRLIVVKALEPVDDQEACPLVKKNGKSASDAREHPKLERIVEETEKEP